MRLPLRLAALQGFARSSTRARSVVVGSATGAVLLAGAVLLLRARGRADEAAPGASPKPVTVIVAKAAPFQPTRSYVGTLQPWLAANVGPQLVSAYVETVAVRPGAVVRKGDLLATLDCRDASAASRAVAMEARAIDARQRALGAESARLQELLAKKFVSPNEAEMKAAGSAAEAAHLQSQKARLSQSSLEVGDCVLRAPFDGEVSLRAVDPGAFVRPGMTMVSVVDRHVVRLVADVPETDFDMVPPGTVVQIVVSATHQELSGTIARRSPAADPSTRTVRFEVDLDDPARGIPVGTTGEARIAMGQPRAATEIPLAAASMHGKKATVFTVEEGVAHARTLEVLGELGGNLFVETSLVPGTRVVVEGRALLSDKDRVTATEPPP